MAMLKKVQCSLLKLPVKGCSKILLEDRYRSVTEIREVVLSVMSFTPVMMQFTFSLKALRSGVLDVIPHSSFDNLTAEDFRLLLNGCGEVNVQQLISYTCFNDETGGL